MRSSGWSPSPTSFIETCGRASGGKNPRDQREWAQSWCLEASHKGRVALISACYWGGPGGGQHCFIYLDGEIAQTDCDINTVLRFFGVKAADGQDEFDTVGMGRNRHTDQWAAEAILEALLKEGRNPAAALTQALDYERPDHAVRDEVRKLAASQFGQLGEKVRDAIPELTRRLKESKDGGIRAWAAKALGDIGPAAKTAEPALRDAMRDADEDVSRAAGQALKRICGE